MGASRVGWQSGWVGGAGGAEKQRFVRRWATFGPAEMVNEHSETQQDQGVCVRARVCVCVSALVSSGNGNPLAPAHTHESVRTHTHTHMQRV